MDTPSSRARTVALYVALGLVALCLLLSWATSRLPALSNQPDEYNIVAWELRHLPNKWLYKLGAPFRNDPEGAALDATIARFLELNRQIDRLEARLGDPGADREALNALRRERDGIENDVEAAVESRLTTLLDEAGITRDLVVTTAVFPPVDAEFTAAPYTLAASRRDRIELIDSTLLREDLTIEQIEAIEKEREQRYDISALGFPIAGVGAYPTLIDYPVGYSDLASVITHEWMHNYLVFSPLGVRYYVNDDLRTMNETVADLVGQEIGRELVRRWPIPEPVAPTRPPPETTPAPPTEAPLDVGAELRRLRGEVDELLAAGRIDEAESLMETRRQELAARGYRIRRINQAFFAFTNLYAGEAGSPAATNPIGPKIDELRRRSADLHDFVTTVSQLTSVEALDRALAAP